MHSKAKPPLKLSVLMYRHELQELAREKKITHDIERLLSKLIGARLYGLKLPRIDSEALLVHAQHHLGSGVILTSRDGKERWFDVMVFVADNPAASTEKARAILVPRFPGGQLRRLGEIRMALAPSTTPIFMGME